MGYRTPLSLHAAFAFVKFSILNARAVTFCYLWSVDFVKKLEINHFSSEKYNMEITSNKKTPEGVYAGCVGLRKNYGYVGWQWKVE